ncbi:MAG: hypothetical protein IJ727_04450 [Treponema sp.]|nr:hypothetical protein [Treponema sp.]
MRKQFFTKTMTALLVGIISVGNTVQVSASGADSVLTKKMNSLASSHPSNTSELYDINNDGTNELFFETKSQTLIYLYSKASGKAKKIAAIHSKNPLRKDRSKNRIIVALGSTSINTYQAYRLSGGKLKKVTEYKIVPSANGSGSVNYYRNNEPISSDTFFKYSERVNQLPVIGVTAKNDTNATTKKSKKSKKSDDGVTYSARDYDGCEDLFDKPKGYPRIRPDYQGPYPPNSTAIPNEGFYDSNGEYHDIDFEWSTDELGWMPGLNYDRVWTEAFGGRWWDY